MRIRTSLAILVLLAVLFAPAVSAVDAPVGKQAWYYEIGGAEPLVIPPNKNVVTLDLGGSASLNLGYSCGKFSATASVTNLLNNLKQGLDDLVTQMVAAASSAIAALPAYILQRANPGLYELFQNYLVDAQNRVEIAFKTCEEMERDIAEGKNPYEDWIRVAKHFQWKSEMESGNDVVSAKESVEDQGGDAGIPWIFGTAGGAGQPPIEVIRDTSAAGYNVTLNKAPNAAPSSANASGPRLVDLWPTAQAASDWAVAVLGDKIVRTCDGCERSTRPGTGLLPQFEAEREVVETDLTVLLSGGASPSFANLDKLSAPGVGVSRALIESLKDLPPEQQAILAGRLGAEIAQARTLERALAVRRLLLTGRRVPEAQQSEDAQQTVAESVEEMEREIDNFLYEARVRREIVSTTAAVVLREGELQGAAGLATPTSPQRREADPFLHGRVKQP
jgi:integrating conjugative element protein (TIGR03755 family)